MNHFSSTPCENNIKITIYNENNVHSSTWINSPGGPKKRKKCWHTNTNTHTPTSISTTKIKGRQSGQKIVSLHPQPQSHLGLPPNPPHFTAFHLFSHPDTQTWTSGPTADATTVTLSDKTLARSQGFLHRSKYPGGEAKAMNKNKSIPPLIEKRASKCSFCLHLLDLRRQEGTGARGRSGAPEVSH